MQNEFDETALKGFDGKDGRPAYICAHGRVIDVTGSPLWRGGRHMMRHDAGRELTADLAAAPHGPEVLDRYPQAGRLVEAPTPSATAGLAPALPPFISAALKRWPILRRHPHPATVHFPIVFSVCAAFFSLLYAITGKSTFDATAFYCLIGALVFMPAGIATGLATWRINYMGRPMRQVAIKRFLSFAVAIDLAVVTFWRAYAPSVLDVVSAGGIVYLSLVVAQAPAVLTVGYLGGTLTFPLDKD
jgi:predicted heme/steroid binding protein/uncharacterized membrane protein